MRSIVLAVVSLLCIGAGILTTPIPVVGTLFSFGAPALALLGVVLGGMDISRARREGQSRDAALAGVILSALCFFPALATSLTCGVCNALWSSTPIEVRRDIRINMPNNPGPNVHLADGGTPFQPPPFAPGFGRADAGIAPARPGEPKPPPAALPPPPLPAGPRTP